MWIICYWNCNLQITSLYGSNYSSVQGSKVHVSPESLNFNLVLKVANVCFSPSFFLHCHAKWWKMLGSLCKFSLSETTVFLMLGYLKINHARLSKRKTGEKMYLLSSYKIELLQLTLVLLSLRKKLFGIFFFVVDMWRKVLE